MRISSASPRQLRNQFLKLHKHLYHLEHLCQLAAIASVPDSIDDGSNRKRDVVTRALLALRKATAEQRAEIFKRFGTEETLTALTDLEAAALNGATDRQQVLPL